MQLFSLQHNPRLLVALLTALVQGALLCWLHTATRDGFWPGTATNWLMALYAVAVFVPFTVQLLCTHWRRPLLWIIVGTLAVAFFYFGWHFGADVAVRNGELHYDPPIGFTSVAVLGILWLHLMPFLHVRLGVGRWRSGYAELFSAAWQQALMLAEAALFTGLFWALLMLWAALFKMLGYEFFKWMFSEPVFAYPFTTVAFSLALYLTGSVERMVTVAREQLLGVLKWLAPVAGLILALFAPTLLLKLPELVFNGERAISAAWLLWLLAFTVLLLNAGYQNGQADPPYPRPIASFLRFVTPAMVVVAATALYALFVRVVEYGITVERVYAIIVALAAACYSVGYTFAAFRRGPWLRGIESVNLALAVGIIILLAVILTPLGSPYRLSAASQSKHALQGEGKERESALHYLRFRAGSYGQRALEKLARLEGDEDRIVALRTQAERMLKREHYWKPQGDFDVAAALASIKVYPEGRALDPVLSQSLRRHYENSPLPRLRMDQTTAPAAIFLDLNGDSVEECAVVTYPFLTVFTRRQDSWEQALSQPLTGPDIRKELHPLLAAGDFSAVTAQWRDLRIGKWLYQLDGEKELRKALGR